MKKEYDFIFVMSSIPIKYPTGGIKIIYRLTEKLAYKGYKVAILFITDPFRIARTLFPAKKKIRNMNIVPYLIKNLLNNKFSNEYIIPIARNILRVKYNEYFSDVDIFFSKKIPNDVISKRYIATDYITAFNVYYEAKSPHKYYISQHDEADPVYLGELSWLAKEAYKLSLILMVINNDMMQLYEKRNPVLFHVGIEDYFFNSYLSKDRDTDIRILIPLRKGEMKGAVYGIDAARLIHEHMGSVSILAYGSFPRHKVPLFIEYHYLPSNRELLELYQKSTIFLLPSILEGMSLPALEAMASGCVVVSTDCVGIRVYLKDGINSIIVDVRDSNALFSSVQKILDDKSLFESLKKNALLTASQYTYDNMTKEFLTAIDKAEEIS